MDDADAPAAQPKGRRDREVDAETAPRGCKPLEIEPQDDSPLIATIKNDQEKLRGSVSDGFYCLRSAYITQHDRQRVVANTLTSICLLNIIDKHWDEGLYCCLSDLLDLIITARDPSSRDAAYHAFLLAVVAGARLDYPEEKLQLLYGQDRYFRLPDDEHKRFQAVACLHAIVERNRSLLVTMREHLSLITSELRKADDDATSAYPKSLLFKWNVVAIRVWSPFREECLDD